MLLVSCKEHLEYAVERFVDENEAAPDVVTREQWEQNEREALPERCVCCESPAAFVVFHDGDAETERDT